MKSLLLDSGPVISLTTGGVLWILEELQKKTGVSFCITEGVKRELVDRPLETRRFKFEALQVQRLIDSKVINVLYDERIIKKGQELSSIANSILSAHGQPIRIVQIGEMETLAASVIFSIPHVAIDERITRTLLENPKGLELLMEKRLHLQLDPNEKMAHLFSEETRHINVLRSIELVTIAFEKGLLNKYVVNIKNSRRELLESVLWSMKLNGCSVSEEDINKIVKIEKVD